MNIKHSLLLLILLGTLSCNQQDHSRELIEAHSRLDSLSQALDQEKETIDSITTSHAKETKGKHYPLFFGKKYKDIEDPEEYIKNELQTQPELIPLSPVLGGTMQFREIYLLTEKWLLAIYEDGHIQGKAIMEYELQQDGHLKFTIVATQE